MGRDVPIAVLANLFAADGTEIKWEGLVAKIRNELYVPRDKYDEPSFGVRLSKCERFSGGSSECDFGALSEIDARRLGQKSGAPRCRWGVSVSRSFDCRTGAHSHHG